MGLIEETKRVWDRSTLDVVILFVTSCCNFKCGFCLYADRSEVK